MKIDSCFLNNLLFQKHIEFTPNKFTENEIDVIKKIQNDLAEKSYATIDNGVILYLVYYGRLPFSSDDDTSTLCNIINQEIIINNNKNIYANDLILKCLDKNYKNRITAVEILSHPFIL